MLDAKFDSIFSVGVAVNEKGEEIANSLLIRACKINLFLDKQIYSELDEQTFDAINSNNGFGMIDVEFVFESKITTESYPVFFTKCFVMRTDTDFLIKPMKMKNNPAYSKVDQAGHSVVGIRYYFRDEEERERMLKSNRILVEGFIALEKTKNVYGVMCQMKRDNEKWELSAAYTYRPKYAKNIKWL